MQTLLRRKNLDCGISGHSRIKFFFSTEQFFKKNPAYYIVSMVIGWIMYRIGPIGVFPKWHRNSHNSETLGNLINHWSMNWTQFNDSASHMYLSGAEVAYSSLTQEVAGWQIPILYCNDKYFVIEFSKFIEII